MFAMFDRRIREVSKRLRSIALTALIAFASVPAAAQGMNVTGSWACTYGVRDTGPLQRPAVYMEFQMQVLPGGGAQGQGTMAGGAGQFPMSFQGNWQLVGSDFIVQGQMMALYPASFAFGATVLNSSQMSSTINAQDGNVIASTCQRIS